MCTLYRLDSSRTNVADLFGAFAEAVGERGRMTRT